MFKRFTLVMVITVGICLSVSSVITAQSKQQALRLAKQGKGLLDRPKFVDDLNKGLEKYEEELRIFRKVKATKDEGIALDQIGHICKYLSKYAKALEHFEKSFQIVKSIGNA